ncbi:MAG: class I SAM-dependent methyltransferase [Planctomycetes bacterium]|nr:class I SAM-dependent methyltransferase [Planctomycetota bacterium]
MIRRAARVFRTRMRRLLSAAAIRYGRSAPVDLKTVLTVEGQISAEECRLLYDLAAAAPGAIVEIGSYRGRSTVALALGSRAGNGAAVFAIEPHEPFTGVLGGRFGPDDRVAFFENLLRCRVVDLVHLVGLPSQAAVRAWDRPIGLLWIDGDHSLEAVRGDFSLWGAHVIPGGLIALHDATQPDGGPARVIAEALAGGKFAKVREVDLTVVLRKTGT